MNTSIPQARSPNNTSSNAPEPSLPQLAASYAAGKNLGHRPEAIAAAFDQLERAYRDATPKQRTEGYEVLLAAQKNGALHGMAINVVEAFLNANKPAKRTAKAGQFRRPEAAQAPAPKLAPAKKNGPIEPQNRMGKAGQFRRPQAAQAPTIPSLVNQVATAQAQAPRLPVQPMDVIRQLLDDRAPTVQRPALLEALTAIGQQSCPPGIIRNGYQALLLGMHNDDVPVEFTEQVAHFLAYQAHRQLDLLVQLHNYNAEAHTLSAEKVTYLVDTLRRMANTKWLDPEVRAEAQRFVDHLQNPTAPPPTASVQVSKNYELGRIQAHLGRFGRAPALINKVQLAPVTVRHADGSTRTVRLSVLTDPIAGTPQAFVSSTSGAGSFSKFKLAVFPDGRVVGARMVRTLPQVLKARRAPLPGGGFAPGQRRTEQTHARLYIDEREALAAANSPFAPQKTMVDDKGRVYDLVEMADGDLGELASALSPSHLKAALPAALEDLLANLVKLEEVGMVHHDIKPANILWRQNGTFDLGDYGLAHSSDTHQDSLRGTLPFWPPEAIDGAGQQGHSKYDLYALGLSLVAMLNPSRGLADCPLAFSEPDRHANFDQAMLQQASNIRAVYHEWSTGRTGNKPLSPDAQQLEAGYQQMAAVNRTVASLVYVHMLNADDGARTNAQTLLNELHQAVPIDRKAVQNALFNVAETNPANVERKQVIAALQERRQAFAKAPVATPRAPFWPR